ncbi:DUF2877 domain-containing protein [Sporosarcina sp. A2]|uniref:DUF2877 domain-containing protein n=1 Tax=Sporosarcina sp. A2 TaxID=3393449 RepID=UPI003D7A262A
MDELSAKSSLLIAAGYEQSIPLLLTEQPVGTIHSVFPNGLNIRMGERLFFIGTTKNGQLPFGIHLTGRDLQEVLDAVNTQSLISWKSTSRQVHFGEGAPVVSLTEDTSFNWEIKRSVVRRVDVIDNLAMLLSVLLEEPHVSGLGVDIEDFLTAYLEGSGPLEPIDQQIYQLLMILESSDVKEIVSVLRYFLGRGQGLTPSGDDHLVGLLAIHAGAGIMSQTVVETLTHLVQHESLTTDIGREYLLYAADDKFSSTVVELASALTQKTDIYMLKPLLLELLDMGHSSGIDTVFGMLLGLLALRRKLE